MRAAVEPRTDLPVAVAVGDVTSEIDPKTAGLIVDWSGTIDRAGSQPLNPITRLRSFFTTREVGVATLVDDEALDSALQQLAPVVSKPPAEGTVRFEGVTPVPVPPVDGQDLDLAGAKQTLERDWTSGQRVELPITVLHPVTSQDDVTKALTDIATPAVSGPVVVDGEKRHGHDQPRGHRVGAVLPRRRRPGAHPRAEQGGRGEGPRPPARLLRAARPRRDAELRRRPPGRDAVAGRPRGRLRGHAQGPARGADQDRRRAEDHRRLRVTARQAHHRAAQGARDRRRDRRVHHPGLRARTRAATSSAPPRSSTG